jgi:hypothetical protein
MNFEKSTGITLPKTWRLYMKPLLTDDESQAIADLLKAEQSSPLDNARDFLDKNENLTPEQITQIHLPVQDGDQ